MLSFILLELTLQEVLADVPQDPAAVLTYAMLVLFVAFVWAGSRGGSGNRSAAGGGDDR